MAGLRRRRVDTPVGELVLAASDRGLRYVLLPSEGSRLDPIPDDAPWVDDDAVLEAAAAQLAGYFAGERRTFDLPLDLPGSDFERAAWLALADIGYGCTSTYGAQAEAIGHPGAFRAVGAANGRNPVPIVLPCHRVIGADGSLVGFGGGLALKQRLLDLEAAQQPLPGLAV